MIEEKSQLAHTIATDFAVDIHLKLPETRDLRSIDLLLADLGHHIQIVKDIDKPTNGIISSTIAKSLEREGRNLWNLCVRLKRHADGIPTTKEGSKLLLRARLFGFQILELGRDSRERNKDTHSSNSYLMNLVLTLGKLCLAESELDSARLVLQKAAVYAERLKVSISEELEHSNTRQVTRPLTEYLALRMTMVSRLITLNRFIE